MSRIETKLGNAIFQNPVIACSGCFGYAYEMERFSDIAGIGAVTPKSVT